MDKEEKFDIRTNEIEFKYGANNIKLTDFRKFANDKERCQKFGGMPKWYKRVEVASWDIYYAPEKNSKLPFEFMRHRVGSTPELTIKIKENEKNNNHRYELDVHLSESYGANHAEEQEQEIKELTRNIGFVENFRIWKYCDIYWYEKIDIVYYISYDENMVEQGKYVEIEARKDYDFKSKEEAEDAVKEMEAEFVAMGITPQNRIRKSQWEINRREVK